MGYGFSTKAIHSGQEPEEVTGAVNVPIFQTSTYAQQGIGQHKGFEYARTQNPTRSALEACIADLEGGTRGFAFASGLAAIDAVMRLLSPGDHVIAGDDMYGGTFRLFDKVLRGYGYTFTYVDLRNPGNVRAAITDATRMIYAETPTNPMMRLCDLGALGAIAKETGLMLVVDNTFMSPYLQNPISHGATIALHSSTKYIGGHSDLIGGLVVTNDDAIATRLGFLQNACGAVPGPQDCYLTLRSLKTLSVRMDRHCSNAARVAEYLTGRPEFTKIYYPGLADFPQRELALRQMRNFGGMISADLGSLEKARAFCAAVRVFAFAESLGGVESLLCHPVSMTHGSVPPETRAALGITDGLIRFSVGIEDVDDLIADIEQALRA
ncbi:MAG: Cys/Met metabolism pyridoxal-phosphate-dependent protein [Chlorobi bacterium]|nr:Cys/Met metabolism pyridoxal-phosphate-dependent protein [Chlorobiota bacterium]